MKAWIHLHVSAFDRPTVEVEQGEDEEDEEAMTVHLSDDVSLTGSRADVERWVRDLAAQVAMAEATGR